jgi:hypothetical protein
MEKPQVPKRKYHWLPNLSVNTSYKSIQTQKNQPYLLALPGHQWLSIFLPLLLSKNLQYAAENVH